MSKIALDFAREKHAGQTRKFTKEPYIHHIVRVAGYCKLYVEGNPSIIEQIAYLHDVIEDTDVTHEDLQDLFIEEVADGVLELTNLYIKSNFPGFKRYERKRKEIDRLAQCPKMIQQIKLCDRLDNVYQINLGDEVWQSRYRNETLYMLQKFGDAQTELASLISQCL